MIQEKRGPRPPQQYWKLDVWEDDARRRKRWSKLLHLSSNNSHYSHATSLTKLPHIFLMKNLRCAYLVNFVTFPSNYLSYVLWFNCVFCKGKGPSLYRMGSGSRRSDFSWENNLIPPFLSLSLYDEIEKLSCVFNAFGLS